VSGPENIGRANNEPSGMSLIDLAPSAKLDVRSEIVYIERVGAAVPETEAIGRIARRIGVDIESDAQWKVTYSKNRAHLCQVRAVERSLSATVRAQVAKSNRDYR